MPRKRSATDAPSRFQRDVDGLAKALASVAEDHGEERMKAARQKFDQALRTARGLGPKTRADAWEVTATGSFASIIGVNLKQMRSQAGWTQERLARAMEDAGYGWKRITCAEVEAGTRRISLEELAGVGALFGVPAVTFMLPDQHTSLELPKRVIHPDDVRELLLGRGTNVGEGGADWSAPLDALPDTLAERPAPDLDNSR